MKLSDSDHATEMTKLLLIFPNPRVHELQFDIDGLLLMPYGSQDNDVAISKTQLK